LTTLFPTKAGLIATLRKRLHSEFTLRAPQKGLPQRRDNHLRPTKLDVICQGSNGMRSFAKLIPVDQEAEAIVRFITAGFGNLRISTQLPIRRWERTTTYDLNIDTVRTTHPATNEPNAALERPWLWRFEKSFGRSLRPTLPWQ
jgi:hypothetical protein